MYSNAIKVKTSDLWEIFCVDAIIRFGTRTGRPEIVAEKFEEVLTKEKIFGHRKRTLIHER
jgi:hypothetical protein